MDIVRYKIDCKFFKEKNKYIIMLCIKNNE